MKFETLFLELVDSTNMIRALLSGITQQESTIKPNADAWSILETLCHLLDEEREDFREKIDLILHRREDKWHPIDPTGWVTKRKYNEQNFADIKEKYFSERSKSLDWLKGLESADWDSTYISEYGKMTAGDILVSWIAHDNLALRQLVELRRYRIEKITKPYSTAYAGDW